MRLTYSQQIFTLNISRLIDYIFSKGYKCVLAEVYRTPEQAEIYARQGKGIRDSMHCKKLAADILLFSFSGTYLTDCKEYEQFGRYWESLNLLNAWGGDFPRQDGVHFEMREPK